VIRHSWIAAASFAAAVAAWIDFGAIHEFQHADSLIPVLVSTQRWTPFFWGQDRFGMLVPLLAMPVQHPLANLLLQGWLNAAAALLAPFIVARYFVGPRSEWLVVGALTNALLLAATPPVIQFDWLITQPYALAIALGFGGLILAADARQRPTVIAALVLLILAHWVNQGIAVLLAVGLLWRRDRVLRSAALVAVAFASGVALSTFLAPAHTTTALTPVGDWVDGWRQLVVNASTTIAHPAIALGTSAAMAVAVIIVARRPAGRAALLAAAFVVAIGVVHALVVGTSAWVKMNLYYPRYMFPTLMMFGVAAAIVVASACAARATALTLIASALVAAMVGVVYGVPSIGRVSRRLDAQLGRMTPDVIATGAGAIAGDYWTVWPAVFHANLAMARAHSNRHVYALTYRSDATDALWYRPNASILVAGLPDDGSVAATAERHHLSVFLLEHRAAIDLFAGKATAVISP
jgi:hypothetical protein